MLWGPVGLEKPIDSMTWRISPTTKFSSAPSFPRVRLGPARPRSKNPQKTEGNGGFQSKMACLGINWPVRDFQSYTGPSWPAKPSVHESKKVQKTEGNARFESKIVVFWAKNEKSRAPPAQVGPSHAFLEVQKKSKKPKKIEF